MSESSEVDMTLTEAAMQHSASVIDLPPPDPMIRAALSGVGGVTEQDAAAVMGDQLAMAEAQAAAIARSSPDVNPFTGMRPDAAVALTPDENPYAGSWQPMDVEVVSDEEMAEMQARAVPYVEPVGQIVFDVTKTRADFLPTQGVHDGIHRTAEMM